MELRIVQNPIGFLVQWKDDGDWVTVIRHRSLASAQRYAEELDLRCLSAAESERVVWTND